MSLSQGFGEDFGDAGVKNITTAYAISALRYETAPPLGKIIIQGDAGADNGGGQLSIEELPAGTDYAVKDKNGNIWTVDEQGNISRAGQVAAGGLPTAVNTEGISGTSNNPRLAAFSAEGIALAWDANNSRYAFDDPATLPQPIRQYYPKVRAANGEQTYLPFKAVINGQTDVLDAHITLSDTALNAARIIFKTLLQGKEIPHAKTPLSPTQRRYTLTLKGAFDYAQETVLAVLLPADTAKKQQVISAFTLVHLSPKTIDLSLVPLDQAAQEQLPRYKAAIQDIYQKVGVTFNIAEKPLLDISDLVQGDIDTGDPELMSTYTKTQQRINNRYPYQDDRYVLFITSRRASKGQQGYFRLNGHRIRLRRCRRQNPRSRTRTRRLQTPTPVERLQRIQSQPGTYPTPHRLQYRHPSQPPRLAVHQ